MYAGRLKARNQKWGLVFQQSKFLIWPKYQKYAFSRSLRHINIERCSSLDSSIRKYFFDSFASRGIVCGRSYACLSGRFSMCLKNGQLRVYSSEGDGRNASEDNHRPVNNDPNFDKGKTRREKVREDLKHFSDAHARLGEQDQKEWLNNEKLALDSKKKESPFLTRREKFKNEFARRILPWQKIHVSWETFPYYIQ